MTMTKAIGIGIDGGGGTEATTTTNAVTAEITIVGETSIVETATKTGMTSGRIEVGEVERDLEYRLDL